MGVPHALNVKELMDMIVKLQTSRMFVSSCNIYYLLSTYLCTNLCVQEQHMVSVTLPCHIDTTNTTKQLSKNVCQNETGAAVTSLTTKCTDNHGGAAQTEVISGALVSGAAALLASYLLHCS